MKKSRRKIRGELIALLRIGYVDEFNAYRKEHPEHKINLRKADLRGSHLRGVNLSGANLTLANLSGAELFAADLRGIDADGANFTSAKFHAANLDDARMQTTDCGVAALCKASCRFVDFSFADLEGTDFAGANLEGARTTGSLLWGAMNLPKKARDAHIRELRKSWDRGGPRGPETRKSNTAHRFRVRESSSSTTDVRFSFCIKISYPVFARPLKNRITTFDPIGS